MMTSDGGSKEKGEDGKGRRQNGPVGFSLKGRGQSCCIKWRARDSRVSLRLHRRDVIGRRSVIQFIQGQKGLRREAGGLEEWQQRRGNQSACLLSPAGIHNRFVIPQPCPPPTFLLQCHTRKFIFRFPLKSSLIYLSVAMCVCHSCAETRPHVGTETAGKKMDDTGLSEGRRSRRGRSGQLPRWGGGGGGSSKVKRRKRTRGGSCTVCLYSSALRRRSRK